jgi:hypothetical protein
MFEKAALVSHHLLMSVLLWQFASKLMRLKSRGVLSRAQTVEIVMAADLKPGLSSIK